LNRFTFLKNAKYAGPNDEYICTGSDSGHAWIYEKATGAVVSFLNADHSTCNGVVPHPSLPLFITYGIDSTAKLWRASIPVDPKVDDSPLGRARFHKLQEYEKSPVVSSWKYVKEKLSSLRELGGDPLTVLPDEIPTNDDVPEARGLFSGVSSFFFPRSRRGGAHGRGGLYIGNDLRNLPEILRQNYFACVLAQESGDDEPIRSSLEDLKRRISLMRLRHQADSQGLLSNAAIPWLLRPRKQYIDRDLIEKKDLINGDVNKTKGEQSCFTYGDVVDLIPNFPCDWIPYDPELSRAPRPCGLNFNTEDYANYYQENYGSREALSNPPLHAELFLSWAPQVRTESSLALLCESAGNRHSEQEEHEDEETDDDSHNGNGDKTPNDTRASSCSQSKVDVEQAYGILHETVMALEEAGNKAVKWESYNLAARRYDLALQYCAVGFMMYPTGPADLVFRSKDAMLRWSPLLKLLIAVRLDLSMVLLKSPVLEPKKAADQAMMALLELGPFCSEKGKVKKGKDLDIMYNEEEPEQTFLEAKELEAKAFFRLGSAQCEIGDYGEAVRSYEHSIESTKSISKTAKPERVVLTRLADAKRENSRKNKRQRKKLKAMFEQDQHSDQVDCDDGSRERSRRPL